MQLGTGEANAFFCAWGLMVGRQAGELESRIVPLLRWAPGYSTFEAHHGSPRLVTTTEDLVVDTSGSHNEATGVERTTDSGINVSGNRSHQDSGTASLGAPAEMES